LKPGGKFVCLDTTPPANKFLKPFIRLYMRIAIPIIGAMVTGRFEAYDYLIRSSEGFTPADTLAREFREAGYSNVGYKKLMFGTAAIHWGSK
jgi:demethylmenaquinone methyltransferase / 2-methoxy-6-polyprenyl-1,4-benzoquinol methylase